MSGRSLYLARMEPIDLATVCGNPLAVTGGLSPCTLQHEPDSAPGAYLPAELDVPASPLARERHNLALRLNAEIARLTAKDLAA